MSVTTLDTLSNATFHELNKALEEWNEIRYEITAYEIFNHDIIRFHNEQNKDRKVTDIRQLSVDALKAVEKEVKGLDDADGTLYSYRDYLRGKEAIARAKEEQPEDF